MPPAKIEVAAAKTGARIVGFTAYVEAKKAGQLAELAEQEAQCINRGRLEIFLKNLLAELEAA